MDIIKVLHGHRSAETAFVIHDYPYSFTLRCTKRVWLEFRQKHGMRFMSQTTNPKRGNAWNKPHASTYSDVGVMVIVKSEESPTGESVTWTSLSLYDNAAKVAAFETAYAEAIAADENVRKQLADLKLHNRVSDARSKLNRIFENAVKHLEGTFEHYAFVKLFEGDDAFGTAIAEKWEAQTEGVGVIKDWVRDAFKVFMEEYHIGWEQARAMKPLGFKLLSPRMDTIQEGDLRYFPPYIKEWTVVTPGIGIIGQTVQSGGGFWCRKKNE